MPLAVLGLIFVISGPSVLIAFLKLRKRNLAPLLDGNGWAVNTRAIINIPFGTSLTQMAVLPAGAQRSLVDPYAEKKRPWKLYLFILLLLGSIAYLMQSGHLNKGTIDTLKGHISTLKDRFLAGNAESAEADDPAAAKEVLPASPEAKETEGKQTEVNGTPRSATEKAKNEPAISPDPTFNTPVPKPAPAVKQR